MHFQVRLTARTDTERALLEATEVVDLIVETCEFHTRQEDLLLLYCRVASVEEAKHLRVERLGTRPRVRREGR